MSFKLHRRVSPRVFAITAVLLTVLLCVYYSNFTSDIRQSVGEHQMLAEDVGGKKLVGSIVTVMNLSTDTVLLDHDRTVRTASNNKNELSGYTHDTPFATCPRLGPAEADIDTVQTFQNFNFEPTWMKNREYWDKTFEDNWKTWMANSKRPPLKIIIVPHSHNDPGWLKTYEQYFYVETKEILNNMLKKLQQYPNMTFIWSEISFLSMWWDQAHPTKRKIFKKLVEEERLEITTGGWVMTDEATSHVYAMVDQLIEGHQWLTSKLNFKPKSGWSIDPFGHGSTVPYLLSLSGIGGTVIQRIHYAWKQWLAKNHYGDFYWIPNWKYLSKTTTTGQILTHNQPFDIYSIKHSCGPHPYICLHYDFRKIFGEYTENSAKAVEITANNVERKSKTLMDEYSRTGSLYPHNVVLMPLGDDFRYNLEIEWDQQYTNYKRIIDYVNSHPEEFDGAQIVFGTPKDYFNEIIKRYQNYPKLKGDFFVYSDIFSEGRPAYWSGYFTTRPFAKLLSRQLEHNLRNAEILYTIGINQAKVNELKSSLKVFERKYEKLIKARRNLGLFQHHDAITGTSKFNVMKDYTQKLFESIQDMLSLQQDSIQSLLFNDLGPINSESSRNFILSDLEYEANDKHARKIPINLDSSTKKIILFNSLGQNVDRPVILKMTTYKIKIFDFKQQPVDFQVNPVWNATIPKQLQIIENEYEILFIAKLDAFSLATYFIEPDIKDEELNAKLATIYCDYCQRENANVQVSESHDTNSADGASAYDNHQFDKIRPSAFRVRNMQPGDVQLESSKLKLLIDGNTGFLKTVAQHDSQISNQCHITFSAYPSAQFHSGAYLFMPDPNTREEEKDVLKQYREKKTIIITSGSVASELSVMYGPFLIHTIRIFHNSKSILSSAIFVENEIDFEKPPKNRETEFFMRIQSDIQNGEPPEFYSDLNGFQMQRRVKTEQIGIEGNYFPITTMAYIEDKHTRLSILTNHAQGAASWQPGQLEVMLERRTLYDDSRGMGEGVVDNLRTLTQYVLLIEPRTMSKAPVRPAPNHPNQDVIREFNVQHTLKEANVYSRPSLLSHTLSNALIYPVNIFILDENVQHKLVYNTNVKLLEPFPCDVHLMNFRTTPDSIFSHFPSNTALMILQRQSHDCQLSTSELVCDSYIFNGKILTNLKVHSVQKTSLTGLHPDMFVTNMTDLILEPMSLTSLQVTFETDRK